LNPGAAPLDGIELLLSVLGCDEVAIAAHSVFFVKPRFHRAKITPTKQRDVLWKTFGLERLDGAGKAISADVRRHVLPQFFVANEERFDHP